VIGAVDTVPIHVEETETLTDERVEFALVLAEGQAVSGLPGRSH
jgi:hypothetical protein